MKYLADCNPSNFVDVAKINAKLPNDLRRNVYDTLYTMAVCACRGINNHKQKTYRKNKKENAELDQLLKCFNVIETSTTNDPKVIKMYLYDICKALMILFDKITQKFNVCGITYFIKYCQKLDNIFYNICEPIFDDIFCKKYNQLINEHSHNTEHQIYLAICRVAAHLSWSQNDKISKMVYVLICTYITAVLSVMYTRMHALAPIYSYFMNDHKLLLVTMVKPIMLLLVESHLVNYKQFDHHQIIFIKNILNCILIV